jgi:dynein heavy chain
MAFDSDPRLQLIESYTQKTLKVKNDKWQKLLSQDEQKQLIVDWVEKGDNINLIMIVQPNGIPLPCYEFPATLKGKAVYFVKKGKIALSKSKFRSEIIYGDLSNSPLEQLSALVDEVKFY